MKAFTVLVVSILIVFSLFSCSDNSSNNVKPPDFSPYIIGTWTGNTVFKDPNVAEPDTLYFVMTLDGIENQITGQSDFTISGEPTEILDVTGKINYPALTLSYQSDTRSFSFSGQFTATNSNIINGTLQNQRYGSLPITFTKK